MVAGPVAGQVQVTQRIEEVPSIRLIIGAVIGDSETGAISIPLARRIDGPGMQIGGLVAMIPTAEFTSLFAAVPLARDTVSVLLRPDGSAVSLSRAA
jgi:hypothetical protein